MRVGVREEIRERRPAAEVDQSKLWMVQVGTSFVLEQHVYLVDCVEQRVVERTVEELAAAPLVRVGIETDEQDDARLLSSLDERGRHLNRSGTYFDQKDASP